jgi:hypothetical protein
MIQGLPEIKLFNFESKNDCEILPPLLPLLTKAMEYFFSCKSLISSPIRFRPFDCTSSHEYFEKKSILALKFYTGNQTGAPTIHR